MKSSFDLDPSTNLRTASIVFEMDSGDRFLVDAGPGENAWEALQRYICNRTQQTCQVHIVEPGKTYTVTFPDGTTKTVTAII
ncbi:hypothetical protein [Aromatoleum bremense]|uniref:MBL fold metallo-hydrolase n=1 Tax=Aromatoleum bremense TaxID=76115 RepID=A0ABX1NZS3_9RHOO|nr:hypothetical protein [Aromatoleum bremense]NMG16985.1 hypothetical protein [Aromatoleum bremense]